MHVSRTLSKALAKLRPHLTA
ncbi:Protein of unknown function [Micromonospora lupini str. Lupac 08]|uniref:Uncharacterized protein n=2 Tax=Micromonospora lupini TaxID=285679 RepID=I0L6U0_9ACTN|nr:Protein of unknown function [Micromonospora lupini str. Lupac 08]